MGTIDATQQLCDEQFDYTVVSEPFVEDVEVFHTCTFQPTVPLTFSNTASVSKSISLSPSTTPIPSSSQTSTPSPSSTSTSTPTSTSTQTPTRTSSSTRTQTPTSTSTQTPTSTASNTPSTSSTQTPTSSPSSSPTQTPTQTSTSSSTQTPSQTQTPTSSSTRSPSQTPTSSPTQTPTQTPTSTATQTPTQTPTSSATQTPTQTPTSSSTQTPTQTSTQTPTSSSTQTPTSTSSQTATASSTVIASQSNTPTSTATQTATSSSTQTPSQTQTSTQTPTQSSTQTPSQTPTQTATQSSTQTPSQTPTQTPTQSASQTPSQTATQSATRSPTQSATQTPTQSTTQTPTQSATQTATQTPTQSSTQTPTQTSTQTPTRSVTPSSSPSVTPSSSNVVALSLNTIFAVGHDTGAASQGNQQAGSRTFTSGRGIAMAITLLRSVGGATARFVRFVGTDTLQSTAGGNFQIIQRFRIWSAVATLRLARCPVQTRIGVLSTFLKGRILSFIAGIPDSPTNLDSELSNALLMDDVADVECLPPTISLAVCDPTGAGTVTLCPSPLRSRYTLGVVWGNEENPFILENGVTVSLQPFSSATNPTFVGLSTFTSNIVDPTQTSLRTGVVLNSQVQVVRTLFPECSTTKTVAAGTCASVAATSESGQGKAQKGQGFCFVPPTGFQNSCGQTTPSNFGCFCDECCYIFGDCCPDVEFCDAVAGVLGNECHSSATVVDPTLTACVQLCGSVTPL
eukprot:c10088_g1_i1.p1 GENE.c10088_g1_i1~~c10088_g1_i1.p1  ORF type:complete len:739 (+),score=157.80 c10088_g1_i1:1-2217(+)